MLVERFHHNGELEAGPLLVAYIRYAGNTALMMSSRLTSDVKVHAREDIHTFNILHGFEKQLTTNLPGVPIHHVRR